jgi:hypothetical protein
MARRGAAPFVRGHGSWIFRSGMHARFCPFWEIMSRKMFDSVNFGSIWYRLRVPWRTPAPRAGALEIKI